MMIIDVRIKVFGCAHENKMSNYGRQNSGILGLGFRDGSLVKQPGGKFSLRFGDIRKTDYQYKKLSTIHTSVPFIKNAFPAGYF